MKAIYKIGEKVKMSEDAMENYGHAYAGKEFTIVHISKKYMPAKEFYPDMPQGYHPGFDKDSNSPLYDFDELSMSLYEWEITQL